LTDDVTNIEAARARLRALREQRLAERIEAGEIVSVKLFIVAGSEAEARGKIEEAKADKLAELHAAGETREVVFTVELIVTGVLRHGEEPSGEPWKPVSPPFFPGPSSVAALPNKGAAGDRVPKQEEPQPVFETYVQVQVRRCDDDDDPGEIAEGWYSIDGKVLTVTDAKGRYVGSRAMLEGEDARVVAKQLLREKVPESERFNRRLSYPNAGLA
jgi:hypothetical protein